MTEKKVALTVDQDNAKEVAAALALGEPLIMQNAPPMVWTYEEAGQCTCETPQCTLPRGGVHVPIHGQPLTRLQQEQRDKERK